MKNLNKWIKLGKFCKDRKGSLEGLPLYILIMVVIAAISLAAILGFMIWSTPRIGDIHIEKVKINGKPEDKVICDFHDARGTYGPAGTYYYRGCDWPWMPASPNYSSHLNITVYTTGGDKLPNARIKATSDCNVSDAAVTDGNGFARLSLKGLKLKPNQQMGEIKIEVVYQGTIGEEPKHTSITVIRG